MSTTPSRPAREFDVIVFGASGYTGRLVAQYLLQTYPHELRWAMAGRDASKLAEVRALIGAPQGLPVILADAADPTALKALAARTEAVITTAGPYQLYGEPLLAACAHEGTDYVDLCGESHWIAAMIGKYEAAAKASGARLVFSCGFDSIPFDLGVLFAQSIARRQWGAPAPRIKGRIRGIMGGLSGGTLASGMTTMIAAQKDPAIGTLLADPFALTPGFQGPPQPDGDTPYFDEAAGAWAGPFMMAGINTKAVHRSNFLLGHPWGRDFQYDEMQLSAEEPKAGAGPGFAVNPALKPGEGPTAEERENGWYDILIIAEAENGRRLKVSVKGDRDPGYGSTAKMLAESALCLVKDTPRDVTPGGAWTTASAMGEALIRRLEAHAGLTFNTED
jgi:short subunit dehydrogenase-like uncharacterized protein